MTNLHKTMLRRSIEQAIAEGPNKHLLLPPEPEPTLLRRQLFAAAAGEDLHRQPAPSGNITDWYEGLHPVHQDQLALADQLVSTLVLNGGELSHDRFQLLFEKLSPSVQQRVVAAYTYYTDGVDNRMPFWPKITPTEFAQSDGLDTRVFEATKSALDTATVIGGIAERQRAQKPDDYVETPYKPGLRDSIDASIEAHEFHNTGASDVPDIRADVEEIQPSLREMVEGAHIFHSDPDG